MFLCDKHTSSLNCPRGSEYGDVNKDKSITSAKSCCSHQTEGEKCYEMSRILKIDRIILQAWYIKVYGYTSRFSAIFTKGTNFVISCLFPCLRKPFQKWSALERKKLLL